MPLALALIETDRMLAQNVSDSWPRLFGAAAAGSRGMLSSIAGSMITVAGVVFSITIVSLSLASSQYSSQVLRNFMRDVDHLFSKNRGEPADEAEGSVSTAQQQVPGAIPARRTATSSA